MKLDKIPCPKCSLLLIPLPGKVIPASSFNSCLRRCDTCGIGFSNSKSNPTIIYKDYKDNIPKQLWQGLNSTLDKSLNVGNRGNKKNKIAFSTSEDALTWTLFKYFINNNKTNELLELLNIGSTELDCEFYLWGVDAFTNNVNNHFHEQFVEVSKSFNEDEIKRSEPDVIIKLKNKLIFIEVKYKSKNDIKYNRSKFEKYKVPDIDFSDMLESGHYELFRNWAFAYTLSKGQEFELINLGPKSLFSNKDSSKLTRFENSLKAQNGRFTKLTWQETISKILLAQHDQWFQDYLTSRFPKMMYKDIRD